VHHYLVVANRTLGGPQLLDAIRARMDRGPALFWVCVPATPTSHLINDFNALSCAFPVDPEVAASAADVAAGGSANQHDDSEASARLGTALQRLRALGATVEGAVGDPDPLRAIDAVLSERAFDEILLSTMPPGVSRWLALDLPHRLRRRTGVPLTVLTAGDDAVTSRPADPDPAQH
jgi:hypothetical protein